MHTLCDTFLGDPQDTMEEIDNIVYYKLEIRLTCRSKRILYFRREKDAQQWRQRLLEAID